MYTYWIDQDEEHADFIKRLRIKNNLNERYCRHCTVKVFSKREP